jgi:hypothetical protein
LLLNSRLIFTLAGLTPSNWRSSSLSPIKKQRKQENERKKLEEEGNRKKKESK